MTSPLPNVLVTATPTVPGYPILTGTTDDKGNVLLPMNLGIPYKLTFSGIAIGTISSFMPANAIIRFPLLKANKSLYISNILLSTATRNFLIFAYGGNKFNIKAKPPSGYYFVSWLPSNVVSNNLKSSTVLTMPESNLSLSYVSKAKPPPLLAVDGYSAAATAKTNSYSSVKNTWTAKANDLTARYGLAAGVIASKLYAVYGSNGTKDLSTNDSYNPSTNTWTAKANALNARANLAAGVIDSRLYAVDGSAAGRSVPTNDSYNPSTNTWTAKANDLTARHYLAAGVIASRLYAVDGSSASAPIATNNSYNPSTNTWTAKANDLVARYGLAAGVIASRLYAVDGYSTGVTAKTDSYNPSTNTWTAKANDLVARDYIAAGVVASKLYAVDGHSATTFIATNNSYNPSTNTWTAKANDLVARDVLAAGVI
ncbi:MAG: hypothetical protein QW393_04005 [Candidatus Micrarchaeaceae archaeon]